MSNRDIERVRARLADAVKAVEVEPDLATPRGSDIPPASKHGTLRVIEIFNSIQGEGTRSGEPAAFIRLAGCNLRCNWCDTPYSWTPEGVRQANSLTLDEIVEQVRESSVVLTGGEPMLHRRRLPELISKLRANGVKHITIETNATLHDESLVGLIDLWSLSPKLAASGEEAMPEVIDQLLEAHSGRTQLKFVVTSARDWFDMWDLLEKLKGTLPQTILIQPDGTRDDYDVALRELAERVLVDDELFRGEKRRSIVRVTAQVHRIIWGNHARGV